MRQYGMRFFPWSVIATVLATLLPAGVPVGPSAAAAATEGSSRWHTTFVEYGDGPTGFQHGRRFKITFDGGAGDRVRVGPQDHWSSGPCGARLVRDGSPVETYDGLTRFWTLPARDRYTFKVVNCGDDIDRLRSVQLLKLRTHRVVGESLRLVRQTGYVDAAVVRTPDSGPPVIVSALARKTSKTWVPGAVVDLDTHQGRRFEPPGYQGGDGRPIAIPDMIVEPAQPLRFLHGYFDGVGGVDYAGLRSAPGSRRLLIVPQGRKIVRISVGALPRPQTTVEVGSGSLSTTVHRRPSQMTSATVTTTTQQWARLVYEDGNRSLSSRAGMYAYLTGPGGEAMITPEQDLVRLPVGTSLLRFGAADDEDRGRQVRVRLLPVRQIAPVPTDGTPLELSNQSPDEWTIAPLRLDAGRSYQPRVTAATMVSEASTGPAWRVTVAPSLARPTGWCRDLCPDRGIRWLERSQPVGDPMPAADVARDGYLLFSTGATTTGTVTVTVTPVS